MNHKIRLGPIAIFLAVIAVVLTSLATLTVATSRADMVLAERFAEVTAIRYELDAEGERFLAEANEKLAAGRSDPVKMPEGEVTSSDGSLSYELEKDGYVLKVTLEEDPASKTYKATQWKINKIWAGDDSLDDIWPGM